MKSAGVIVGNGVGAVVGDELDRGFGRLAGLTVWVIAGLTVWVIAGLTEEDPSVGIGSSSSESDSTQIICLGTPLV